jgi:hypothetical protein
MVHGKTKVAELKPKPFQIMERLDAGVDVDLFSKTIISVVSDEHHRHPVIAGVTRNLFRATAIYKIHIFYLPVAPLKSRQMPAACDKKHIWFDWRKKGCDFSSAGLTLSLQTTQYSQSQL